MQRFLLNPSVIHSHQFIHNRHLPLTAHHTPICCLNSRVLGAPDSLSTFEKRDLMRNLLLFNRFSRENSAVASDGMKDRIDQLRSFLPTETDGNEGGGSQRERGIFKTVERVLSGQPGCTVESNLYLDGCFEADIVITRISPDGSKSVYNIEVDGPSHSLPTKLRLSQRRDQHLQEACGVKIDRIQLLQSTGKWLQSGEYEAAVRVVLERLQLL
jgi:hypothetical protein